MDRPVAARPPAPRLAIKPAGLARLFFLACIVIAIFLAVPPAKQYLSTSERAAATHRQLEGLQAQERRLGAQSAELSHGSGLEEQARRQGLIDPSERSYVIQDLPQP